MCFTEISKTIRFKDFSKDPYHQILEDVYNYTFRYAKEAPKGYKLFKVWKKEFTVYYKLPNGHKIYYKD